MTTTPVTRRGFLTAASALWAGGPLLGAGPGAGAQTTAPAQPGRVSRLSKAVKLGMVAGEMPLAEKFALLKQLGFDGVELDSPNALDPEEVLAARNETGLIIHGVVDSVHWQAPLSHPDQGVRAKGREALETALRDCRRYGGTTVLLVPAVVSKQVSYAEAHERSRAEIAQVLPLAEELRIRIALENVWNNFLLSPLEAAAYVDGFESPWIGWYLDVGNIVNYGWPEQWVRTLGRRIFKVDVKEYSRAKRDAEGLWKGFDVELLEGDCDWPAVMAALREIGYLGWFTAEIRGGDAVRLGEIAQRMDRILGM